MEHDLVAPYNITLDLRLLAFSQTSLPHKLFKDKQRWKGGGQKSRSPPQAALKKEGISYT